MLHSGLQKARVLLVRVTSVNKQMERGGEEEQERTDDTNCK
jgi:hypothetical protein